MSFGGFVVIGLIAMFLCMVYCGKQYGFSLWRIAISALSLTAAGVFGAYIMGWVESGYWGSRSLFGGVFMMPIMMWATSKILGIRYGELMDVCTPAGFLMLSIIKIKCKIDGCCAGRFFRIHNGEAVQFPSQIVESAVTLVFAVIMILIIMKGTKRGIVFPIGLLIYGVARFILSFLRYPHPWILSLPAGAFWSVIAMALSITTLVIHNRKVAFEAQKQLDH